MVKIKPEFTRTIELQQKWTVEDKTVMLLLLLFLLLLIVVVILSTCAFYQQIQQCIAPNKGVPMLTPESGAMN